jgi:hypothetical protein
MSDGGKILRGGHRFRLLGHRQLAISGLRDDAEVSFSLNIFHTSVAMRRYELVTADAHIPWLANTFWQLFVSLVLFCCKHC